MLWLLLLSFSLCFGLQQGKIPLLSRIPSKGWWGRLLSCSYCTGFHTGWIVFLAVLGLHWAIVPFSFCSAISCYIMDVLLQWVESRARLPQE